MDNQKLKEAIKVATAFVIAYGLALNFNWLEPKWAGFSAIIVALPTLNNDQSLKKSFLRILGNIIGSIASLIILSVASQNRFLFMFLIASWGFIATFMMSSDKENNYVWFAMGISCLVISTVGPADSGEVFEHAIYRILENFLGVGSFTIVSLFMWRNKDQRDIKKTSEKLFKLSEKLYVDIFHQLPKKEQLNSYNQIITLQEECLSILNVLFFSAYNRKEIKYWKILIAQSKALLQEYVQLNIIISQSNIQKNEEHELLFQQSLLLLKQISENNHQKNNTLIGKSFSKNNDILLEQLHKIYKILEDIQFQISTGIGDKSMKSFSIKYTLPKSLNIKLNRQYLLGAFFSFFTIVSSYFIWLLINPPGGKMWYMEAGAISFLVGSKPQINLRLIRKNFAMMCLYSMIIYVSILPNLSSYYTLGPVLFIILVIAYYNMPSSSYLASAFCVMVLDITNVQSYNFEAIVNQSLFIVGMLSWVLITSYLMSASRPEKVYLNKVQRFIKSTSLLVKYSNTKLKWYQFNKKISLILSKEDINSFSVIINKWTSAIQDDYFENCKKSQLENINNKLQAMSLSIATFIKNEKNTNRFPIENIVKLSEHIEHNIFSDQFSILQQNNEITPDYSIKEMSLVTLEDQLTQFQDVIATTKLRDLKEERF